MYWGLAPLVQALTKPHVLVVALLGLSSLCFWRACFALIFIRFFSFSFSLQAARLESQRIPPFGGSHAFLAFLASATAFFSNGVLPGLWRLNFFVCLLREIEMCVLALVKAFWTIRDADPGFFCLVISVAGDFLVPCRRNVRECWFYVREWSSMSPNPLRWSSRKVVCLSSRMLLLGYWCGWGSVHCLWRVL